MTVQPHSWQVIPRDGFPRNSRFPDGTVENILEGKWIKNEADAMSLGSWVYPVDGALPDYVDNFTQFWNYNAENANSNDLWAPVAAWNPEDGKTYMILDRTPGVDDLHSVVFQTYDALNHAYLHQPLPDKSEGTNFGNPHVYGRWALDVGRQKVYRPLAGDTEPLWVFDIATQTWTNEGSFGHSELGGGTSPIAMHEALGELLGMDGSGDIYAWNPDTDTVRLIGTTQNFTTGQHGQAHYNWVRKEWCIALGNSGKDESPEKAYMAIVDENENITETTIPAGASVTDDGRIESSTGFVFHDPISGHYLAYEQDRDGDREIWEYDPDTDQWAVSISIRNTDDDFPGFNGHLIVPIPEAGVILWLHRNNVLDGSNQTWGQHQRLYKHNAVL